MTIGSDPEEIAISSHFSKGFQDVPAYPAASRFIHLHTHSHLTYSKNEKRASHATTTALRYYYDTFTFLFEHITNMPSLAKDAATPTDQPRFIFMAQEQELSATKECHGRSSKSKSQVVITNEC